jgi:DNA (cytosine-5)-methyltransferase 1
VKFLSVCSGIEAASVAWHPLGLHPWAFAEVEPFPSAVLAHHYPSVPNFGDMNHFKDWPHAAFDVLAGGTPCQSFSVAGLRKGLADPRGNLMLTYLALADRYRPAWLVWENVPGVLSSGAGRDFGTFLGGLALIGYGFAYRVLNAQYFGVPQRRRRVFVVASARGWQRAAAVLFECHSLQGHPAPRREAGQGAAGGAASGAAESSGGLIAPAIANPLTARMHKGINTTCDEGQTMIAHCLGFNARQDPDSWAERTGPLDADGSTQAVAQSATVRRLTPRECERLQGFPDDYTLIQVRGKPAADGPRYKALGNSMAVPVMRWIGERLLAVDQLTKEPLQ